MSLFLTKFPGDSGIYTNIWVPVMVLCMKPTEERQPYEELEVNFATMNLNSWQVQHVLQAPPHRPYPQSVLFSPCTCCSCLFSKYLDSLSSSCQLCPSKERKITFNEHLLWTLIDISETWLPLILMTTLQSRWYYSYFSDEKKLKPKQMWSCIFTLDWPRKQVYLTVETSPIHRTPFVVN